MSDHDSLLSSIKSLLNQSSDQVVGKDLEIETPLSTYKLPEQHSLIIEEIINALIGMPCRFFQTEPKFVYDVSMDPQVLSLLERFVPHINTLSQCRKFISESSNEPLRESIATFIQLRLYEFYKSLSQYEDCSAQVLEYRLTQDLSFFFHISEFINKKHVFTILDFASLFLNTNAPVVPEFKEIEGNLEQKYFYILRKWLDEGAIESSEFFIESEGMVGSTTESVEEYYRIAPSRLMDFLHPVARKCLLIGAWIAALDYQHRFNLGPCPELTKENVREVIEERYVRTCSLVNSALGFKELKSATVHLLRSQLLSFHDVAYAVTEVIVEGAQSPRLIVEEANKMLYGELVARTDKLPFTVELSRLTQIELEETDSKLFVLLTSLYVFPEVKDSLKRLISKRSLVALRILCKYLLCLRVLKLLHLRLREGVVRTMTCLSALQEGAYSVIDTLMEETFKKIDECTEGVELNAAIEDLLSNAVSTLKLVENEVLTNLNALIKFAILSLNDIEFDDEFNNAMDSLCNALSLVEDTHTLTYVDLTLNYVL